MLVKRATFLAAPHQNFSYWLSFPQPSSQRRSHATGDCSLTPQRCCLRPGVECKGVVRFEGGWAFCRLWVLDRTTQALRKERCWSEGAPCVAGCDLSALVCWEGRTSSGLITRRSPAMEFRLGGSAFPACALSPQQRAEQPALRTALRHLCRISLPSAAFAECCCLREVGSA